MTLAKVHSIIARTLAIQVRKGDVEVHSPLRQQADTWMTPRPRNHPFS